MSPLFSGLSGVLRNDVVSEKKQFISSMQATFRGMYWMRFWASLQHEDARKPFDWPAEHWKLFHWTFSPRADGGAIIEFAYNHLDLLVFSFPFFTAIS